MADEKTSSDTDPDLCNYLEELDLNLVGDDFDVEVSLYHPPSPFKTFIFKPFSWMPDPIVVECKTGQFKLPKKIIRKYADEKGWNFENYSRIELLALLYLHYFKDCDEWADSKLLDAEITTILEALPKYKTIDELFTYSFMQGDIKATDFDQIIETDDSGPQDVTGLSE